MKKVYCIMLVLVISFASCTKSTLPETNSTLPETNSTLPETNNGTCTSFIASTPDNYETKTSLDGLDVYWSTGDEVDVIYDLATFQTSHEIFTLVGEGPTKTGKFQGTTDLSGKNIFVVYPKSSNYYDFGNSITIPRNVTYGSASTVIPMYGTGLADNGIVFNHLCSVLKFSVYSDEDLTLQNAELSTLSTDKISGTYTFKHTASGYGTTLNTTTDGSKTNIVMDFPATVMSKDINNPTELYFVIRGNIHIQPSIKLIFSDGSVWQKTKASLLEVEAGKRISFPICKVSLPSGDKEMNLDNTQWEDFDVDDISTATSSIQLRSTSTCFTVSDINSIVKEIKANTNSGLTLDMSAAHFYASDGIFPRLTDAVLDKLSVLKLPEGITEVTNANFYPINTGSLTDIYFPTTILKFINGFTLPGDNITSSTLSYHIDNSYFKDINGIIFSKDGTTLIAYPSTRTADSYTIPSTVTYVKGTAFCYAKYIKTINVPASVTTFEGTALNRNLRLENIVFAGTTAPTLTYASWGTSSIPGSLVSTDKQLQIPNAGCVTSYNNKGWDALTDVGYTYVYTTTDSMCDGSLSDLGKNDDYNNNLWH